MHEEHEYCHVTAKLKKRKPQRHAETKRSCDNPSDTEHERRVSDPVQEHYDPPVALLTVSKYDRFHIGFEMQKESVETGPARHAQKQV